MKERAFFFFFCSCRRSERGLEEENALEVKVGITKNVEGLIKINEKFANQRRRSGAQISNSIISVQVQKRKGQTHCREPSFLRAASEGGTRRVLVLLVVLTVMVQT